MATDLAPVTPDVLRWARESIGVSLDEAAKRAGVSVERIEAWEAGNAEPTLAKLRTLAKLYQRPLAVFFLPEPPRTFDSLRDFRRLPSTRSARWSRPLHKVYRRALDQQEIAVEILEAEGTEPSSRVPAVALEMPSEDAAGIARNALAIPLKQQFAWRRPEESLAGWLEAVEELGVLVLRTSDVPLEEMRGFSITGEIPALVINALDSFRGQVFTLLHELAHLMLRQEGLCILLEPDSGISRVIEGWCSAVAAAVLMPADSFLDSDVVGPPGEREWDEDVLVYLSRRYGASREAVLRRLVTLNRASWEFYLAKREEYLAAYEEQRENERLRRRESGGGPPPYRMTVRDRGKPYVRLVLDAYQREAITPSSLSRLLGLKLKHLPDLEREVRS